MVKAGLGGGKKEQNRNISSARTSMGHLTCEMFKLLSV